MGEPIDELRALASSAQAPGERLGSYLAKVRTRAYSVTVRPARAATPASAVPHAPAPITATELYDGIDRLSA